MKLKSIEINAYKSIKTRQTIEFGENGLTTFVGKNGSGKTNILEAIKAVFDVNSSEYFGGCGGLGYSVKLELDDKTYEELKEIAKTDDSRVIEVFNGGFGNELDAQPVDTVRSPLYASALRKLADDLTRKAETLRDRLNDADALLSDACNKYGHASGYYFKTEDIKNSTGWENNVNYYKSDIKTILFQLANVAENLGKDEIDIFYHRINDLKLNRLSTPDFRVVYNEPDFAPFELRHIKVDIQGIKDEIEEFNKNLEEYNNEINRLVGEFNKTADKFSKLAEKERKDYNAFEDKRYENEEKYESFMKQVKGAIARKCVFIPGGDGNLIFGGGHGGRGYHSYYKLLIETYLRLKYSGKELEELLKIFQNDPSLGKVLKQLKIGGEEFAEDFEIELNRDLPSFDKAMIDKIEVGYGNGNGLELFVAEKGGERVAFENTSLGRKWYFTYYFTKKCLKRGDVFILDEPGAFLHPEAQTELLRELEELSKTNPVIICTHSPYMVSDRQNELHLVEMKSGGTCIKHLKLKSLERLKKEAGFSDFESISINKIVFALSRPYILCEGIRDAACIKAFMRYFKINPDDYTLLQLSGCDHAYPVIEFFINNDIPLSAVMDKDSEEKMRQKKIKVPKTINANESAVIGEIPERYLKTVFVGGNGREDIEGLFADEDREIYLEKVKGKKFKKVKLDIGEILPERGCSRETQENFAIIFKKLGLLK